MGQRGGLGRSKGGKKVVVFALINPPDLDVATSVWGGMTDR